MSNVSRIEVAGGGDLSHKQTNISDILVFSLFVYGVFSSLA